MSDFDRLIQAKNETEFFMLICNSVYADLRYIPGQENRNAVVHTEISRTHDPQHGSGLKFEIEQTINGQNSRGKPTARREKTHIFALYEDKTLTWWMAGQPLRTGLQEIQEGLRAMRPHLGIEAVSGRA